jgi:hypothetical protein
MVKISGVRTGAVGSAGTSAIVGVSDGSLNAFNGTYNAPTGAVINFQNSKCVQISTDAAVTAGQELMSSADGQCATLATAGNCGSYVALETAGAADVLIWAIQYPGRTLIS